MRIKNSDKEWREVKSVIRKGAWMNEERLGVEYIDRGNQDGLSHYGVLGAVVESAYEFVVTKK